MDDFATVIWVVIIAGAMIFNVVSQSRKARGKGARTPGHEEAWPSQAIPGVRTGPDAGSAPCAVARCTRFSGRMPESGGDSRRGIAPEHTTPKAAGRAFTPSDRQPAHGRQRE